MVTNLGGQPLTHPLGENFYSQAPLRWGNYVAKVMVAPISPNLVALTDQLLALHGNPNALRQAAIDTLAGAGGEWEVRVQLCIDEAAMPIEDASVAWPEDKSPYRTVARIRVPAQPAWSEDRAAQADDRLAFSPWHGLQAHQPLGSINRARQAAYAQMSAFRAEQGGVSVAEPRVAVDLSRAPASAVGTTPGREGLHGLRPRRSPRSLGARTLAGAIGGLAGGMLVSVIMLLNRELTGRPSDLVQLERKLDGARTPAWMQVDAGPVEEAVAHGGHLALSVAAGALFGACKPEGAGPLAAGLAFGLGLGALAYGGAGAALGLTPPPARETTANNVQHVIIHALFGTATALVTDCLTRGPRPRRLPSPA